MMKDCSLFKCMKYILNLHTQQKKERNQSSVSILFDLRLPETCSLRERCDKLAKMLDDTLFHQQMHL